MILLSISLKISWYLKINSDLGLMTELIIGVLGAVSPFLVIYLLWVSIFAIIAYTLGANQSLAEGYTGLPSGIGYFLTAFENSMGNTSTPTFDFLKGTNKPYKFSQNLRLYLIYFFWFLAQIGLAVILLNFVIALISQYYEDVMNRRVMHTYTMKNEMNH